MKLHRWAPIDVFGPKGWSPAPATPGSVGSSSTPRPRSPSRRSRRCSTPGRSPVGLGARDTLRLEMGYALYGHEMSLDINPLEAGLGWVLDVGHALPRPGRARQGQGGGPRPEALRDRVPRSGACRARVTRCSADGDVDRRGHERQPLADAGHRDRARPRPARHRVPSSEREVAIEAAGSSASAGDIVKPPFIRT